MVTFLEGPAGRRLAFVRGPGRGPEVVFLPGFGSDMEGTKALHLEAWARARGRAFVRFDYSGHGASSGGFLDGCLSDWAADAAAVAFATPGRKVLAGSSMGGWIALWLAREFAPRVAGLVGIAPAPDFASGAPPWPAVSAAERAELAATGRIVRPGEPGDNPTVFTRKLIEDAPARAILQGAAASVPPLRLPMPVRLLHGTDDRAVPLEVPLALLAEAEAPDLRLTLLKGADHRLSSPDALGLIETALEEVLARGAPNDDHA